MTVRKISFLMFVVMVTLLSVNPISASEEQQNEKIYNEVQQLKEEDYNNTNQNFTKIDLKPYATRSFRDEVEGDGIGGWSDQGSNDCRDFTERGEVSYFGIPFDIIEPDENDGKSVVVLRGQADKNLPVSADIKIGKKAAGAYFIHTLAYGTNNTVKLAEYTFVYDDGTSATMDVYEHETIVDFWQKHDYATYRTTWATNRAVDGREVSMGMLAVVNPYPEKIIDSIRVESVNGGTQAYIMLIALTLTSEGPYLPYVEGLEDKINPTTVSWLRNEEDSNVKYGSPLDSSFLLEKPAGKHGKVKGGKDGFEFEDGTKIKFWGANISLANAFSDKEKADAVADELAKCGYNIVRFNDIDIGNLQTEKKDSLMYMLSALKKRGIYTYLCMDTSPTLSDFINVSSINTQKANIKAFMDEVNPYTGIKISEDPAVAMVELLSGISFMNYIAGYGKNSLNAQDAAELENNFNIWLKNKYKTDAKLKKTWTGTGIGINEGESLIEGNIKLPGYWKNSLYCEARKLDIQDFLIETQKNYYDKMKKYLVQIGYNGMLTCNSDELLKTTKADAYVNSKTDFIARNVVWNESYGSPYINSNAWVRNDGSMLKNENLGFIGEIAEQAYDGLPIVVSEWSIPSCNIYSAEGFVMMAAYGAKQSWNPIVYTYMLDEPSESNIMTDFYSVYKNPSFKALTSAAARLFYATEEHKKQNVAAYDKKDLLGQEKVNSKVDFTSGLSRIKVKGQGDKSTHAPKYNYNKTDDISINYDKGCMLIDNEYALAYAGSVNGKISFSIMDIEVMDEDAVFMLTSSENCKLKESNSLLFTVVGNSRNKGMKFSDENVISIGSGTIVSQAKECRIRLNLEGNYEIYALMPNGERKKQIPFYRNQDGELVFKINDTMARGSDKALNFEIVRSKEK